MKMFKQLMPLLAGVVVLLIVFRFFVPKFLDQKNMIDLAQQISVNAIIAFGMTLTILIGGIDLSVGAVLALIGTVTVYGLTLGEQTGQAAFFYLAIPAGLLVAALFGLFNGVCASRTRIPPFIITLATMLVARGTALRFNLGQPIGVPADQHFFLAIGNGRLGSGPVLSLIPMPVVIMVAVFALTAILLHKTVFGQRLYAIGGNREAARLSGIPIRMSETAVYIICAVLTGIAGLIHSSQLYAAEPSSGNGFELNAIAAVVVGGTSFTGGVGTMVGTLIGAIIIGILDKGLNQAGVHFSLQYVAKGLVILGAVYMDVRRRRA